MEWNKTKNKLNKLKRIIGLVWRRSLMLLGNNDLQSTKHLQDLIGTMQI